MVRTVITILLSVMMAGFLLAEKQDFERSYSLVPGRHIAINNVMGDIRMTGYKGKEIKIVAKSEGPEKDAIRIVDKSFGPRVELFPICSKFKSNKTRVDFEVKVPESEKSLSIELKTGSGKIEVSDFTGNLVVDSFRGDVTVANVKGNVFAHSISGKIDAKIKQPQSRRWMKFDSQSGNIEVTAPADFEARIEMRARGDIKTDFPIKVRKVRYGGQIARGKLGSGNQSIQISSVFGSVSLKKKIDQEKD